MHNYCTYFDQNYLVRGLTLYRSLQRHASPFVLWVLCFDDITYDTLLQLDLPNLHPIPLEALERNDQDLLATKKDRSPVEYYFTCTPSWLLYVLESFPSLDSITYLDSDLFFYSSPQPIYKEMGNQSVAIMGHRFPQDSRTLEKYGIYNVGYLTFRNGSFGKQCLHWWRERCLEWCYDRVEDGRFADQKYLDDWPVRFEQVVVLQHKGAGLAPWNVENYSLALRNGRVLVESDPLVFFHFHNFKQLSRRVYDPGFARYGVQPSHVLKRHIYNPYIRELRSTAKSLPRLVDRSPIRSQSIRGGHRTTAGIGNQGNVLGGLAKSIQERLILGKRVYHGDLWLVIRGRIL